MPRFGRFGLSLNLCLPTRNTTKSCFWRFPRDANSPKFRYLSNDASSEGNLNSTLRLEPCQSTSLLAIGTRRIFTEEHDLFRQACRKFFEEKVIPFHDKWEEQQCVSRDLWIEAGKTVMKFETTKSF